MISNPESPNQGPFVIIAVERVLSVFVYNGGKLKLWVTDEEESNGSGEDGIVDVSVRDVTWVRHEEEMRQSKGDKRSLRKEIWVSYMNGDVKRLRFKGEDFELF